MTHTLHNMLIILHNIAYCTEVLYKYKRYNVYIWIIDKIIVNYFLKNIKNLNLNLKKKCARRRIQIPYNIIIVLRLE